MESLTDAQRRALLNRFCDRLADGKGLLPAPEPMPFNPVPGINTAAWSIPFIEAMVGGELSEATNLLNHWLGSLRRWHAWNDVLKHQEHDIRWGAEWEWVEPVAFQCLFQPSATRDRFIMIATNAMHQVRMTIDPAVKDELLGDPADPDEERVYPFRRAKEKQLKSFVKPFAASKAFIRALGQVDDAAYRKATADFRNRASHGIPPRLTAGITGLVTRARVQARALEQQPDGRYKDVPVPGRMATSYGYGGIGPLVMEATWKANCQQFTRARKLFEAYVTLLAEATAAMPPPKTLPEVTEAVAAA